jgi:serpin B
MPGASHRPVIALLLTVVVVAGCGSSGPSLSPAASMSPLPAPTSSSGVPGSTTGPALPPSPTPTPADPFLGQVAVTVSDNLRVRSEPRVADDSIKYEPLLPLGTELTVLEGPVSGSGYTWYKVEPVSFTGLEGPGQGWVAMAGKDGEPWIALADAPIARIALPDPSDPRPPADPAAATTAAASINAFGLDLLRAMLADGTLKPDENAVFSPTSIALALAMARAGAKGETAAQMDAVLHTSGWDALGPGLNALEQALTSRNATWQEEEWLSGYEDAVKVTRELALRIANAAFAQRDWAIEQAYLERIASTFGAGVRLVDYHADPEVARKSINAWVSDQTKQRIPELIPPPEPARITPQTRLVLVNAIYLKAAWETEFSKDATMNETFTRLDDSRVGVPTMYQQATLPYARGNGWQATELRYRGADWTTPLAMTLILPDDLTSFESKLSATQLSRISAALDAQRTHLAEDWITEGTDGDCTVYWPYDLSLYLPKFGIDTWALLGEILEALGMPLAFDDGRAGFTDIHVPKTSQELLYISEVIHQANIDVDEKGTEAAAATAVIMGDTTGGCGSGPRKVITLRLDHPFLFVLRDVETGAVLFMGRVVDPSVGR